MPNASRRHETSATPRLSHLAGVVCLLCASACVRRATPVTLTVRADTPGSVIDPAIYGQFAEHLGRLIYEGIWVGEKLADPEHARLSQRRDRGAQGTRRSGAALARRLFRRRIPLARRHRPARAAPAQGQHPLGRRGRRQLLRHARVHEFRGAHRRRCLRERQRRHGHAARNGRVARVHDLGHATRRSRSCAARTAATSRGR